MYVFSWMIRINKRSLSWNYALIQSLRLYIVRHKSYQFSPTINMSNITFESNLSTISTTTTLEKETSESFHHRPVHLFIAGFVITFQTFVIVKKYQRHRSKFEPVHLFQLNFLVDYAVLTFCNILLSSYGIEKAMTETAANIFCGLTNYLKYFTYILFFVTSVSFLMTDTNIFT